MTTQYEPYTESFFFLALGFGRRMRATLEDAVGEVGISVPEYIALMALNSVGPLSNASLARRCAITPQAMLKVTSSLINAKLISRAETSHQRQHLLTLTPLGRRKVAEIVVQLKGIVDHLRAQSGAEDYSTFKRLLGVYWAALGPSSVSDAEASNPEAAAG